MRRLFVSALIILGSHFAQAADLKEVYHLSLENDPTFKAEEAAYSALRQAVPQAIAQFLPQLSGQVSTTGINTGNQFQGDYNTKNYGLNLTQPIYRPEHWSTLEQSRHTERQGLALYLAASQDLILRVSEQYFAILGAQDDLHFARAQRKAFAQQLEQTKQRFDVGLIAITDVHEAQARHDSAVAAEIAAENNLSDQFELLREIIGLPLVDIAELKVTDDVLLILPEPNNLEMWVETAQSHNLDIEAAREGALRAKGEVANRVTGHFPKVDVNASLARNKSAPPFDDLFTQKTINLTLAIPIFEGGGVTYRVREAESRFDEAIQRLDIQRRAVYSLTRQKFRGVLTQISQVRSLAQAVVSNESALRATKAAYEVGTRTVVDVLDAESNLLGAQRDYAKARYEYVLEGLRLKRAAGTLKAQDLYEVNLLLGH